MSSAPEPQTRSGGIPVWRPLNVPPPPEPGVTQSTPILIVGAGPVGLAMALDLAERGHSIILLGKLDFVSAGSKAICFSKRSLDILDRLGVGQASVEKGVTWNLGKVFWKDSREPIYQFDMLPVKDQKMPGFINLQQYHMADLLLARLAELSNVDFRPGHELIALDANDEQATAAVRAGEVEYNIAADWLIACDGSRSFVRNEMGLDFQGRVFEDNFLIADVRMEREQASERWFWFDPPFNPGQSALMHKQPEGIWRLDFQLGWGIDRQAAVQPENVEAYVRAMLGDEVRFEEEWYSVYTFQCRRMAHFLHGRVIFAGDSAHLVAPFGARGCNGGFADIDNLGWKLDLVLRGEADAKLLDSYDHEAVVTADANIQASTRSADFLTPKSSMSEIFRDAVLELASEFPFGRQLVNSGRLSVAIPYPDSPLSTPDEEDWRGCGVSPGTVALDAPFGEGWLLEKLGGGFMLLTAAPQEAIDGTTQLLVPTDCTVLRARYAMEDREAYLIRPDQYVAARWKEPSRAKIEAALSRAKGAML